VLEHALVSMPEPIEWNEQDDGKGQSIGVAEEAENAATAH
jgi:hypothetical protein